MSTRAVSTVVDVSVFLLLVGVAVLTLIQAPVVTDSSTSDRSHEVATVLASSTAVVNHTVDRDNGHEQQIHGTRASLLADATVENATVDGTGIAPDDGFETAVADEIRPTLTGSNWRAEVVVEWGPYPGSHLHSEFRIGHTPPPDADVSIAITTVGSGVSNATDDARRAAATADNLATDSNGDNSSSEHSLSEDGDDGYDAVADTAASVIVAGLFPPSQTRSALENPETRERTIERYRAAGNAYGVELETPATRGEVETANQRLQDVMAERIAADLREEFDSPAAAADALEVETVRVVVRTWSP